MFHVGHKIILRVDDVLHEHSVEQKPVRASIHGYAFWNFPVSKSPHMGVTLEEKPVQTLFSDESVGNYQQCKLLIYFSRL